MFVAITGVLLVSITTQKVYYAGHCAYLPTFDSQRRLSFEVCDLVVISEAIVAEDFVHFCHAIGTDQRSATAQQICAIVVLIGWG